MVVRAVLLLVRVDDVRALDEVRELEELDEVGLRVVVVLKKEKRKKKPFLEKLKKKLDCYYQILNFVAQSSLKTTILKK